MRVWDLHPGYLNRQSLLGEHRELHGIVSIIVNRKKGYAKHPETLRWVGFGWALRMRHQLLAAEMEIRGYKDKSPVTTRSNHANWPEVFIDHPLEQINILKRKYQDIEQGRIPLPKNAQQFWSQHKYSILARNRRAYEAFGREVAVCRSKQNYADLTVAVIDLMRKKPNSGGLRDALLHMWGYISSYSNLNKRDIDRWPLTKLLLEIQHCTEISGEPYLQASTALSELKVWL